MEIYQDYDLTKLNTLGVKVKAKFFVSISNELDLKSLFQSSEFKNNDKFFLGGGSNVLITHDFDGIVILNKLKGIEILEENSENVTIRSMSGEVWHDIVVFATEHQYWGIENLSLIPGTVGAAPMQNIGAYGAELKDVLENVEAINIESGQQKVFSKEECELGYRDSVFKNKLKGKYFIIAITIKLFKIPKPNLSYKILREYLEKPARPDDSGRSGGNNLEVKSPKDISDAVSAIRRSKLPDPKVIGNAGSFFKNIFVSKEKMSELLEQYPMMPYFKDDEMVKIPSAWLIEECGWKGKRVGNVGVHEKQALVLVNHNGGSGQELKDLAEDIIKSVFVKFGLKLVPEVNLI